MLELNQLRKNKINLKDYNSSQDIANRVVLAELSIFEHEILEEILFSPLKFSLKKLARNVGCEEKQIAPILNKLSQSGLLQIQEDTVVVDKETRKFFELHLTRFAADFKPDMEFLQALLKKIPIHLLPNWYAIPRTSNNIFESIIEKYLLTPHLFQRYLSDLNFGQSVVNAIVDELFSTPGFKIATTHLMAKHQLTRYEFEEIALLLELHFVCCVTYEKRQGHWDEYIVPFYEWHQYLLFLQRTDAPVLSDTESIQRRREGDFAFIEDLSSILRWVKKQPAASSPSFEKMIDLLKLPVETKEQQAASNAYFEQLINKMRLVGLIDSKAKWTDTAADWMEMNCESRALFLYRHPQNRILSCPDERLFREAEKSIKRVLKKGWVLFDDFIQGSIVPLHEGALPTLTKTGRHWKYTLPSYNEKEKQLIHATVFEWLFEMGMVAIGSCQGKECFCVTAFGRFFFEE